MDIYWYGQALFKLKGKNATVIIDPFNPDTLGLKLPLPKDLTADVVLVTHSHRDHNNHSSVQGQPMVFDGPGEYEVKGVVITGVSAFHDNQNGAERGKNVLYNVLIDGVNVVHLGDLGQDELTEEQIAELGQVDVLLIPVGSVYTIDAKTAANIISQLEPKIVIPMHYGIAGLQVNLEPVENFLKQMGIENPTPQPKLSITKDKLPDETEVVVLSRS